ncbi:hypothetical protein BDB00DRAFT_870412 [Zychaea mexicana]|uniref:uncharacterized protein n=1 Tax=Zychaea mexicana TaxID=64656 RepID=UPI0022FE7300|nr:uncharacterized protein BDB00DRAFT_870412 [Zychaea mexicana]KAI9495570.1 hypothetical protein BDB00DRAFT_870412 [Zychaea mexicana]
MVIMPWLLPRTLRFRTTSRATTRRCARPLDYVLNHHLPRSDAKLLSGRWKKAWPTLLRDLREIGRLSHPDVDYDASDPEPAPKDAVL